ncbi:transposase family protein [Rhodobacterales bacterium]|nr:transposase family protein [Rhodobacterales bacterium]
MPGNGCPDITFIPVKHGFLYLVAIMDWATRKVLSWRLSNTMHADFCVEALNEAIARFGPPEIMNTPSRAFAAQIPCRAMD